MSELDALARSADEARRQGQAVVVATVVETSGSVYRRPGARMLVRRDGAALGAVSGGCLEADLRERARLVLATGAPDLVTYDGAADDDAPWGLGLGCQGRVTVLLQRLPKARNNWIEFVRQRHARRRPVALVTMFAPSSDGALRSGDCFAGDGRAGRHGRELHGSHAVAVETLLQDALRTRTTFVARGFAGDGSAALVEYLAPPIRLIVHGAGFDAVPIVSGARTLGWHVIVADHRPGYLEPERFPGAELRLGEPAETLVRLVADPWTAAIVMSHHRERDREALRALARAELTYLGVLGPAARTGRLLGELFAQDVRVRAAELGRLYAPVGLALGAETAEEIAIAVLAEIVGVFRQGATQSLRERSTPIHAPVGAEERAVARSLDRAG